MFNLGIGGETSTKLLARFQVECEARNPDIMLIGIGVNDSRKVGSPNSGYDVPTKLFSENLGKLFNISQQLSPVTIFVGMVPVIPYIDNFTKWKKLGKPLFGLGKPKYLKFLADGLHPNDEGHSLIFETVRAFLQNKGYL